MKSLRVGSRGASNTTTTLPEEVLSLSLSLSSRKGGGPGHCCELTELRRTWSAEFIPLPADLRVPRGSGLKSALLKPTAVVPGRGGESYSMPLTLLLPRGERKTC